MKHPVLKNHYRVCCVQTIGELWKLFHTQKSVFVRSWNRVHPCKFFLNNDRHFTIKKLEEMIEDREFYQVKKMLEASAWDQINHIKQSPGLMPASMTIASLVPETTYPYFDVEGEHEKMKAIYIKQNPNTCD